ncbi:MAG: stage II sporulation protein SpoIID, partial [Actinomycetota bacterium]
MPTPPILKRRFTTVVVALAVLLGVFPATSAQADDGQLPGGVVIYGRGFGHGRGLSQYGAFGWATVHGWS